MQWQIQDFPEGGANSQSGCTNPLWILDTWGRVWVHHLSFIRSLHWFSFKQWPTQKSHWQSPFWQWLSFLLPLYISFTYIIKILKNWVGHCQNENQQWLPTKLRWWTQNSTSAVLQFYSQSCHLLSYQLFPKNHWQECPPEAIPTSGSHWQTMGTFLFHRNCTSENHGKAGNREDSRFVNSAVRNTTYYFANF